LYFVPVEFGCLWVHYKARKLSVSLCVFRCSHFSEHVDFTDILIEDGWAASVLSKTECESENHGMDQPWEWVRLVRNNT
jgi:hypothetical protein